MSDLPQELRQQAIRAFYAGEEKLVEKALEWEAADLIEQQQQEIERLKGRLAGHERLASRGIYYTMDELQQHDFAVVLRAVVAAVEEFGRPNISATSVGMFARDYASRLYSDKEQDDE